LSVNTRNTWLSGMSPVAAEVASGASAPGAELEEPAAGVLEPAAAPLDVGVLLDDVAEDPQAAISSAVEIRQAKRSLLVQSMLAA
jgi:hypothetical protein